MSINIKNPYLYTSDDFTLSETFSSDDLVDSSGYLTLSDQISIITNQSEINNEFRRGMIDNFNDEKIKILDQLSLFEEDSYVNNQLLKARDGDLLDKQIILQNAYDSGYAQGFFVQRSDSVAGGTQTLSADEQKKIIDDAEKDLQGQN